MFGDKLKLLRRKSNLTQSKLAEILEISSSTIGMYEQNRRDPDTSMLSKIADYFNVSVDYLLDREAPDSLTAFEGLDKIYLSYAKEAQENKIDPVDIKLVLDTIKKLRKH